MGQGELLDALLNLGGDGHVARAFRALNGECDDRLAVETRERPRLGDRVGHDAEVV